MEFTGIARTTCLVTGAGQGIGATIATRFAQLGVRVAVLDLDANKAQSVARAIEQHGGRALAIAADVADPAAVAAAVSEVERSLGAIQTLVNSAGVLETGSALSFEAERWERLFATNARGVFLTSRAVARRMVPRAAGSIITVGSNAARVPRVHMAAYCASKAAASAFTKCLGLELAEHGIRCNVVSPGSTDTAMLHALWTTPDASQQTLLGCPRSYRVGIPLRKLGAPEDIANAVLFLASSNAGHVTMQDWCVDGGAALGA